MIESLILIEGKNIKEENLRISLGNAKQIIIGNVAGFGVILHVTATSPDFLRNALLDFSKVTDVTGVVTMMLRLV